MGTPNRIAEDNGNPLATIPAMDTIVVAITALLLSKSAVVSIPIAKPVIGATPDSIRFKKKSAHSLNTNLKP
jgi:hypothetical protein